MGITRSEVEELLKAPEQVVPGDLGALVAQSKRGKGLLRVPFKGVAGDRKILTVYWTSKTEKYWEEKKDENKV